MAEKLKISAATELKYAKNKLAKGKLSSLLKDLDVKRLKSLVKAANEAMENKSKEEERQFIKDTVAKAKELGLTGMQLSNAMNQSQD